MVSCIIERESERERRRQRETDGGRDGGRERAREGGRAGLRDSARERRWEGGRERQHLTMMRIAHEHFNCMQTVSYIIERERKGLCP